ncbi:Gldg family protein [Deltaproteobacteria bacterium IMCC39524]|nr:Gldg family protein [Deltaproteobacteria bacterium IMCC39524]
MSYNKFTNKYSVLTITSLFIGINLLAALALSHVRIDLTENKLNTLSKGTHNILESLETPVTLKYYVATEAMEAAPGLTGYAKQVESLLDEYQLLSKGQLKVEKINPLPFSEEEDDAVSAGLQGVLAGQGETLYFGLVAQANGPRQVISFFQPEREQFLEYDLSQLIYNVTHPEKKIVGVLSSLPLQGSFIPGQGMGSPVMLFEQLRSQFSVKHLPTSDLTIPKDIDILMVVNPHGLGEQALYAVDQYVLQGGQTMVFADPLSEDESQSFGQPNTETPAADDLLAQWGVRLRKDKLVGDPNLALQVSYRDAFNRMQTVRYLPWLSLGKQQYNTDEILVNQLGNINLASAGSIEQVEGISSTFVPLITSTSKAGLIEKAQVASNVDPGRLLTQFKPSNNPLVLAARVKGTFNTAFPDGPPEEPKKETETAPDGETDSEELKPKHISQGTQLANLIIIADSDLLQDRFWVQVNNFFGQQLVVPKAANLDLVTNALEILGGSPDLISVRSRGTYNRPFELVAEIQQNAEMQYRAKEQALRQKLEETEQKLNELQHQRQDASSAQLTAEQQQEVDKFVQEKVNTRKKLRDVRYDLRADIDDLEKTLKIVNIGLVPFMIFVGAFIGWVIRRQREREF